MLVELCTKKVQKREEAQVVCTEIGEAEDIESFRGANSKAERQSRSLLMVARYMMS